VEVLQNTMSVKLRKVLGMKMLDRIVLTVRRAFQICAPIMLQR
jgi:hypothetical protein